MTITTRSKTYTDLDVLIDLLGDIPAFLSRTSTNCVLKLWPAKVTVDWVAISADSEDVIRVFAGCLISEGSRYRCGSRSFQYFRPDRYEGETGQVKQLAAIISDLSEQVEHSWHTGTDLESIDRKLAECMLVELGTPIAKVDWSWNKFARHVEADGVCDSPGTKPEILYSSS